MQLSDKQINYFNNNLTSYTTDYFVDRMSQPDSIYHSVFIASIKNKLNYPCYDRDPYESNFEAELHAIKSIIEIPDNSSLSQALVEYYNYKSVDELAQYKTWLHTNHSVWIPLEHYLDTNTVATDIFNDETDMQRFFNTINIK